MHNHNDIASNGGATHEKWYTQHTTVGLYNSHSVSSGVLCQRKQHASFGAEMWIVQCDTFVAHLWCFAEDAMIKIHFFHSSVRHMLDTGSYIDGAIVECAIMCVRYPAIGLNYLLSVCVCVYDQTLIDSIHFDSFECVVVCLFVCVMIRMKK